MSKNPRKAMPTASQSKVDNRQSKYTTSTDLTQPNNSKLVKEDTHDRALLSGNFWLMGISGALIVTGFLLMLGPGTTTEQFEPDIFSDRRIIWGPTIAFIGFVAMGVSIIKKPFHFSIKKFFNKESK